MRTWLVLAFCFMVLGVTSCKRGETGNTPTAREPTTREPGPSDEPDPVKRIEKLGGFVTRDNNQIGQPVTWVNFNHNTQVTDADLSGSRRLVITHTVRDGITLDKAECERTMQCIAQLWGYRVRLVEVDVDTGRVLKEHEVLPMPV